MRKAAPTVEKAVEKVARGLDDARDLAPGTGHIRIEALAMPDFLGGRLDYQHHIGKTRIGDIAAFARAQAGARRYDGNWKSDFQAMGGLELRF